MTVTEIWNRIDKDLNKASTAYSKIKDEDGDQSIFIDLIIKL